MADMHPIERAYREAQNARYKAEQAREREIDAGVQEARRLITAAANATHNDGIQTSREVERVTREAYEAWRVAEATAAASGRQTAVVEYEHPRYGRGVMRPTGRKGVLTVCTSECKFAGNLSRYSLPSVGDEYIRILKADGTPSLQIVHGYKRDMWKPEGWSPDAAKAA